MKTFQRNIFCQIDSGNKMSARCEASYLRGVKIKHCRFNSFSANLTKWSNTLKQFVGCLSVFDHFMGLALKGLRDSRPDFLVKILASQQNFDNWNKIYQSLSKYLCQYLKSERNVSEASRF